MRLFVCFLLAAATLLLSGTGVRGQGDNENPLQPVHYSDLILADGPIAYWSFDGAGEQTLAVHPKSTAASVLKPPVMAGSVKTAIAGPRPERYPLFDKENCAIGIAGDGSHLKIADPGASSLLDFDLGDTITLEAWVNCTRLSNDQQIYILGKGRTQNRGFAPENQNYALRLRGQKGEACVSFLFRSADNRRGESNDFHRWTTRTGFAIGSGWHHVAVTYTFGKPESIRGYVDGERLEGAWDYGGPTDEGPVVDDDEVWIGSSMGGSAGATFHGEIDEIALYRTALDAERIKTRYRAIEPDPYITDESLVPADGFLVEVHEGIPDRQSWKFLLTEPQERYTEPALMILDVPHKYTERGVRGDRSNPYILRVTGDVILPQGEVQLLLRSRSAARLWLDGQLVGENGFSPGRSDGHEEVHPIGVQVVPGVRPLPTGDQEKLVTATGIGEKQRVVLEIYCGGRNRRPEVGETLVGLVGDDHRVTVLGSGDPIVLSDESFQSVLEHSRERYAQINRQRRQEAGRAYTEYWQRRHNQARQKLPPAPPVPDSIWPKAEHNALDRFINARLKAAGAEPHERVDDWSFLRRAALDTIGTPPSPALVKEFFQLPAETRRAAIIDRLLADDLGWADHWTSYWQDVLAENPNIINPTLNNTGPFRWWIHESLVDNKPIDRFATELVLMEGSLYDGGPAGFSMASQNDAPMAAKAHVIAQAFLGLEMKCARCHDAPFHDYTQKELFSLAAMLRRSAEQLPATSTIPGGQEAVRSSLVTVSLKPGDKIPPAWPFEELVPSEAANAWMQEPGDLRERLAALVTAPENRRFGQVIVNRIWHRYLGRGIVEPVDDWESPAPSHPELLEYLERELVASGYDLKHVARLILNSHTYQRRIDAAAAKERDRASLFAGPTRRRLSAEQVVDSLFAVSGKPMNVEELNIDVDAMRPMSLSINLGPARRAWQFTSMSNERDRPSLSLPGVQNIVDVLEAFGWRSTRPDPLTVRSVEPSVLQAAILENGVVGKRTAQLSDDSALTELALAAKNADEFVQQAFERLLTRPPTDDERKLFVALLEPGFENRVVPDAPVRRPAPPAQTGVSWSNHLKPIANERKVELKEQLALGDPPTARLAPDWRERAEDLVWTLINSPEFVLVP